MEKMEGSTYFRTMVKGIDKKQLVAEIDGILAKVPQRPVPDWDRLPDSED